MSDYRRIRRIAVSTLFACIALNAAGEENDKVMISVRAGISGSPVSAQDYFSANNTNNYPLESYYGDYYGPSYSCGAINLGVDFRLLKWFSLCLDINTTPIWHDKFHKDDSKIKRESGVALTVLPMAKFYYFRRPVVMLYGRLGFGFGKYFNYPPLKYSYRDYNGTMRYVDNSFKFEAQFVPIGIEIGKKVFWYAEFGIGTTYMGGQTGIGYRF